MLPWPTTTKKAIEGDHQAKQELKNLLEKKQFQPLAVLTTAIETTQLAFQLADKSQPIKNAILESAVKNQNPEVVQEAIKLGGKDPETKALQHSLAANTQTISTLLLQTLQYPEEELTEALADMASSEKIPAVMFLLKYQKIKSFPTDETILSIIGNQKEPTEIVEQLLKLGVDDNIKQRALEGAVYGNKPQTIKKLAEYKTKINDHHLIIGCNGRPEALEALLQCGANPNGLEHQILKTAINNTKRHEPEKATEILLKYGADPNKETPLVEAINTRNPELIKLLLKAGANPNIKINRKGEEISLIESTSTKEQVEVLLPHVQTNNMKEAKRIAQHIAKFNQNQAALWLTTTIQQNQAKQPTKNAAQAPGFSHGV